MKLLLDTHVWIWASGSPKKLNRRAASAIRDPGNERWLSPISVWELGHLARNRRVTMDREFDEWVAHSMRLLRCREAPITFEIALETRGVSIAHDEPADRIIAATARVLGLTLLTADEALLDAPNVPTMPAG